jgi:hypothetical protein
MFALEHQLKNESEIIICCNAFLVMHLTIIPQEECRTNHPMMHSLDF